MVALGMSLGALGTDTAGSIRIPVAFCGVAGRKPRNGAVPVDGIVALAPSLDSCRPLARTVGDPALMWEAMTGTTPEPVDAPRIGFARDEVLGEMDLAVGRSYALAIGLLREAGFDLVEVELPDFSAWGRPASYLLVNEALGAHRGAGWYPDRAEHYTEDVLGNLRYAEGLSAEKLAAEVLPLDGLRAAFHDALEGVSALLLPTTPLMSPSVEGIPNDPKLRRKVTREVARFATAVDCCRAAAVTIRGNCRRRSGRHRCGCRDRGSCPRDGSSAGGPGPRGRDPARGAVMLVRIAQPVIDAVGRGTSGTSLGGGGGAIYLATADDVVALTAPGTPEMPNGIALPGPVPELPSGTPVTLGPEGLTWSGGSIAFSDSEVYDPTARKSTPGPGRSSAPLTSMPCPTARGLPLRGPSSCAGRSRPSTSTSHWRPPGCSPAVAGA